MSYHGRSYDYEAEPYYNNQNSYYRQDAGGPSSSSSYDRSVPPPRIRRADNLPTKPTWNNNGATRSAAPPRANSPPREVARTESSGGSSNGGFSHRRETSQTDLRALEKATIRKVPLPDVSAAIHGLVSLLQDQQDSARDVQEIQTKNAAIIRLSRRDDISRENKEKGEKAIEEIASAKRKEATSWRKVEEKLKVIVVDLLLHYIEDEQAAIRDFVSSQWKAIGTGNIEAETTRPLQRQERAPPREPSMRSTTAEDGEIAESPAVPTQSLPIAPDSAGGQASTQIVTVADKGKGKSNANALSIKIRDRLDEMENTVLESHERMDQIEAMVTGLIKAEVAEYVDAAKIRREERKAKAAVAASSAPNGLALSSDPAHGTVMSIDTTPTMAPASITSNGIATPVKLNNVTQNNARSKDDFMSREEVDALLESTRNSMRQEFDRKLFEEEAKYRRMLDEMSAALVARTTNNHRAASLTLQKHYEVLENHSHCINRHEELWAGTLGTFSHIPRPQNAPRS